MSQETPFQRRFFVEHPDLIGARWWQEEMLAAPDPVTRRSALKAMLWIGGGVLATGILAAALSGSEDDYEDAIDSLLLQQEEGWNVGATDKALVFSGETKLDARGNPVGVDSILGVSAALAPRQKRLEPFYVSTLFASARASNNSSLLASLRAVATPAMDTAYDQGRALASLFQEEGAPRDIALVVDLPGPESIAFATGVAEVFEPVFQFDNWPHPRGVVPAHATFGAALYYAPVLKEVAAGRAQTAPPAFVLDARRLAAYTDDPDTFDNRYISKLPSAERLKELGTKRVLYVSASSGSSLQELDDLNDDFVSFQGAGIDTKLISTSDFAPANDAPSSAPASGPTSGPSELDTLLGNAPAAGVATAVAPPVRVSPPVMFFYGGSYYSHPAFWSSYGWYSSPRIVSARPPVRPISRGATFVPRARPTMFSSRTVGASARGVGKQKPSGFGRVSKSSNYHPRYYGGGRSGSFGRGSSYSS
jgi:hypothetical protein